MFVRLAAVALVASSFLLGAVAEPIPVPTPAPVLDERGIPDFFNSLINDGANVFKDITGAVGSIATVVTSVGGEAATFITAVGGSAYQLVGSGVNEGVAVVTSIGGELYTVVQPTSTPTTTKNAASPLRAVGIPLPITVSLVSTILAISLGARLVL